MALLLNNTPSSLRLRYAVRMLLTGTRWHINAQINHRRIHKLRPSGTPVDTGPITVSSVQIVHSQCPLSILSNHNVSVHLQCPPSRLSTHSVLSSSPVTTQSVLCPDCQFTVSSNFQITASFCPLTVSSVHRFMLFGHNFLCSVCSSTLVI